MEIAGWVVAGLGVLVLLDRAVARGLLDRRRPRRRRSLSAGGSTGSGMVGELIDVFQPSRTHTTDELERRRHDLQDAGDGAPPVDLEAGTAWVDAVPGHDPGCGLDGPPRPGLRPGARP